MNYPNSLNSLEIVAINALLRMEYETTHTVNESVEIETVEKQNPKAEKEIKIYKFIRNHLRKYNKQPHYEDVREKFHIAKRTLVKIVRKFHEIGLLEKISQGKFMRVYTLPAHDIQDFKERIRASPTP